VPFNLLISAAQFGMAELSWLSGMFVCLDGNVINDVSGITMSPFLKIYRRPPDLQMPGRHPNSTWTLQAPPSRMPCGSQHDVWDG
jgi:hypothetical protein